MSIRENTILSELIEYRKSVMEEETDNNIALTGGGTWDDVITVTGVAQTKNDEIFAYYVDLAAVYTNPICRIMNSDKSTQLWPVSGGDSVTDAERTMIGIDAGAGPSRYAIPIKVRAKSGWVFQVAIDDGGGGTVTSVAITVVRRGY